MSTHYRLVRRLVRSILLEEVEGSVLPAPKGEWVLLNRGDLIRDEIKSSLYGLVQKTYEPIGGHLKINSPDDLDDYNYWVVSDVDDDPDADVVIMGKSSRHGVKKGVGANDGSSKAIAAYKSMSANLHSGGSVAGLGGWWGELSGKPAYAMLSRGAPAVEDEKQVKKMLGDDIEWHGEHPDPDAPAVFKAARGWYTRRIGDKLTTKIIVGMPK